jgi:hypothetical protein
MKLWSYLLADGVHLAGKSPFLLVRKYQKFKNSKGSYLNHPNKKNITGYASYNMNFIPHDKEGAIKNDQA